MVHALEKKQASLVRSFSDPGMLASLDLSITWAAENETNTDFLKKMKWSVDAPDMAVVSEGIVCISCAHHSSSHGHVR